MRSKIFALFTIFLLASCGNQSNSARAQLCRAIIEDVFTPQNNLSIAAVVDIQEQKKPMVGVEYSITDIFGKSKSDTAVCIFSSAPDAPDKIESIIQFEKELPTPYVEFLNNRARKKLFPSVTEDAKPKSDTSQSVQPDGESKNQNLDSK